MDCAGLGHVFRQWSHSTSTTVLKSLQSTDLRKHHSFWLTNRRNIPTVINAVAKIPTTNDTIQCRLTVGFDPAPFCAAGLFGGRTMLMTTVIPTRRAPSPEIRARDTLDD